MWMPGSFFPIQHGCDPRIGAFEYSAPFVSGLCLKNRRKLPFERGPCSSIILTLTQDRVFDATALHQLSIELWHNRADGQVFTMCAFIRAVEVGAAIEHVFATAAAPFARSTKAINHR